MYPVDCLTGGPGKVLYGGGAVILVYHCWHCRMLENGWIVVCIDQLLTFGSRCATCDAVFAFGKPTTSGLRYVSIGDLAT